MNLKYCLFKVLIIVFVILIGCKSDKKHEKDIIKISEPTKIVSKDSISTKEPIYIENVKPIPYHRKGVEVYAEQLYNDYNDSLLFVPLYLKDGYDYNVAEKNIENNKTLLFQHEEESRYKLVDSVVEKYLETDKLDRLFMVNNNQEIIDTLQKIQYEYYSDALNGYYIATYKMPINYNKYKSYNVISMDSLEVFDLRKSAPMISIKNYAEVILQRHKYDYEHIDSNFHFKYKNDTISLIAFSNSSRTIERQYLFRNGKLTDSIEDNFFILEVSPIPLATDTEFAYITYNGVPESDVTWTAMLGIDLEDFKFMFYEKNRMIR